MELMGASCKDIQNQNLYLLLVVVIRSRIGSLRVGGLKMMMWPFLSRAFSFLILEVFQCDSWPEGFGGISHSKWATFWSRVWEFEGVVLLLSHLNLLVKFFLLFGSLGLSLNFRQLIFQ